MFALRASRNAIRNATSGISAKRKKKEGNDILHRDGRQEGQRGTARFHRIVLEDPLTASRCEAPSEQAALCVGLREDFLSGMQKYLRISVAAALPCMHVRLLLSLSLRVHSSS